MSTWSCTNCGLINSSTNIKCTACFNSNKLKEKYWKCKQCDLLNDKQSSECIACFNIYYASFKMENEWIKSYLNLQQMVSNNNKFKLISWKNTLYSLIISIIKDEINISLLHHDKIKLDHYPVIDQLQEYIFQHRIYITYDIDEECEELYILFNDDPNHKLILIIYDLNKENIKKILNIYCNESDIFTTSNLVGFQKNFCIIKLKNRLSLYQQIPFIIIQHWKRCNLFYLLQIQTIPDEIYEIINTFYSFYTRNKLQILLLQRTKPDDAKYFLYTLYHGIIDVLNESNQELKIINVKEIIRDSCLYYDEKEKPVRYLFPVVIGSNLYCYFSHIVLCINLIDGYVYSKDIEDIGLGLMFGNETEIGYDILQINNNKNRYLYLFNAVSQEPMFHPHPWNDDPVPTTLYCELWYFDKKSMQIVALQKNMEIKMEFTQRLDHYDMVYHNGYLHIGQHLHYQLQFRPPIFA